MRARQLVGRSRPGRPVRDRSAAERSAAESAGPVALLDRALVAPAHFQGTDLVDTELRLAAREAVTATDLPRVSPTGATPDAVAAVAAAAADPAAGARSVVGRTLAAVAAAGRAAPRTPDQPAAARSARRLPRPPARKAPLLLVALVVGAVVAALPGGVGSRPEAPVPVAAAGDYGLGAADANFAGGMDDVTARREITQAEAASRLDALAASRAEREPDFAVPTVGRMSTCFCMRWGTMHWGVDLAAPLGTPIVAAADGVVLRAGPASGYGNAIYIQDADGNVEIYGHMRYLLVEAGDVVSAGDLIAKVGSEGQSTGPHLHFEIHAGSMTGPPIDPQEWLAERGVEIA